VIIRRENGRILLIRQRDHAQLSGALAAAMPLPPLDALDCRVELIEAIRRHDDGWQAWDAAPKIDKESGLPLGFDEMPPVDSRAIWTTSIEAAAAAGDLAGWVVAGHFIELAERRGFDHDMFDWTDRMAWQQRARMRHWLQGGLGRRPGHAKTALAFLQFFDAFSLVLCRSPEATPFPLDHPHAGRLETAFDGANRLLVAPWPFERPTLEVRLEAFELAQPVAAREIDLDDLARTTLVWALEAKATA